MVSMTSFSSHVLKYAFDFIPVGLSLLVQSTVIIATGLIVRYVLRRKSAADGIEVDRDRITAANPGVSQETVQDEYMLLP